MKVMKYAVVLEKGPTSYGAYVPDLPGCVVVGKSRSQAIRLIREAMVLHLQSLKENGDEIPLPSSSVEIIDVAA